MGFARTMARFTTSHLPFPTTARRKPGMCCVGENFELVFVAVFASLAADVVVGFIHTRPGLADGRRLRRIVVSEPTDRGESKRTDQECFDESIHSALRGFRGEVLEHSRSERVVSDVTTVT